MLTHVVGVQPSEIAAMSLRMLGRYLQYLVEMREVAKSRGA